MGAGAGVVVLEEAGYASHRGAPVLAEIVGYGTATDVHHPTAPTRRGWGPSGPYGRRWTTRPSTRPRSTT